MAGAGAGAGAAAGSAATAATMALYNSLSGNSDVLQKYPATDSVFRTSMAGGGRGGGGGASVRWSAAADADKIGGLIARRQSVETQVAI